MNLRSRIENDLVRVCSTSSESRTSNGCARWRGCRKSQLEHLIAMLARKCAELEKLKGGGGELQDRAEAAGRSAAGGGEAGRAGADSDREEEGEPRTARPRPNGAVVAAPRTAALRAGRSGSRMPLVSRGAEATRGTGRALGDDRRRRAQVPGRRGRAAEVRMRVRRRRRDRARPGPCRQGWPLLAALRDQGRLRQVRRAPAARAPGALDGAPWPQRHVADAVGSVLGDHGPARADVRRALRAAAGQPRRRRRSDGLARSRGLVAAAVADVVRDSAGARLSPDLRRQIHADLRGPPGRLPRLGRGRRARDASGGRPRVQRLEAGGVLGSRAAPLSRRRRRLPRSAAHARVDPRPLRDRRARRGHDRAQTASLDGVAMR